MHQEPEGHPQQENMRQGWDDRVAGDIGPFAAQDRCGHRIRHWEDNGRPTLDPLVLFKRLFMGCLFGCVSSGKTHARGAAHVSPVSAAETERNAAGGSFSQNRGGAPARAKSICRFSVRQRFARCFHRANLAKTGAKPASFDFLEIHPKTGVSVLR